MTSPRTLSRSADAILKINRIYFEGKTKKKKSVLGGGWMKWRGSTRYNIMQQKWSCQRFASGGHRAGHAVRSFFFFFSVLHMISLSVFISLAILVCRALHL